MNKVCAAGTGSFLEEQADRLGICHHATSSRGVALDARRPSCLGERCTVFMESDLVHHQQRGAKVENLTAGLAYSIVHNYLNRSSTPGPVGKRIFFQGGVAYNAAVAAAFEAVLGRPITCRPTTTSPAPSAPPSSPARRWLDTPSAPRASAGFELATGRTEAKSFICRACPNLCEVKKVTIHGEAPALLRAPAASASRRRAGRKRRRRRDIPDLFAERSRLLLGD